MFCNSNSPFLSKPFNSDADELGSYFIGNKKKSKTESEDLWRRMVSDADELGNPNWRFYTGNKKKHSRTESEKFIGMGIVQMIIAGFMNFLK